MDLAEQDGQDKRPPNVTTHSGLWFTTHAALAIALIGFLAMLSDTDRALFSESNFTCNYIGVDFEATSADESTNTADELDVTIGVGVCLSALWAALHLSVLVFLSVDEDGINAHREVHRWHSILTVRSRGAYVVTLEGVVSLVLNLASLVYVFVCLGYAYTLVLTTQCTGGWAEPKFFEIVTVLSTTVAFGAMFQMLVLSLIDIERDNTPVPWTWHARRGFLACVLACQFFFATPFFSDFDMSDDVPGCTAASTKDSLAWALLCGSLGAGMVWSFVIVCEVAEHTYRVCRKQDDVKENISGLRTGDRRTEGQPQIHMFDSTCSAVRSLVWFRRFECVVFLCHMLLFSAALNTMHMTRVVDVTCTPLAFKMADSSDAGTKHWQFFGMIVAESIVFTYTLGMGAAAHAPVMSLSMRF